LANEEHLMRMPPESGVNEIFTTRDSAPMRRQEEAISRDKFV
jgi:hypothetical protein